MAALKPTLAVIGVVIIALVIFLHSNSNQIMKQIKKVKALEVAVQREENVVKEMIKLIPDTGNTALGKPGEASPQQEFDRLWNYVYTMQYNCSHGEYLGGKSDGDGAYWLCSEPRFWPKGSDPKYKCLMYSFGVGGDFSFDDEIARRGCEVHSFDPTENLKDGLVRESGVIFHKWGISHEDNDHDSHGWKMRTLPTLIKELGHNGRYLDYLKMDTESYEEGLMQQVIDNDLAKCVRHYAQEIHLWGPITHPDRLKKCRHLFSTMSELNNQGWRLYNTTDNCRYLKSPDPHARQVQAKGQIVNGGTTILWETMFVNLDVKGPCKVK